MNNLTSVPRPVAGKEKTKMNKRKENSQNE